MGLSIEEQLAFMREGRAAPISFKMGSMEIPCRVLTGDELVRIEQEVLVRQAKLSDEERTESWLMHEIRKETLQRATAVEGGAPGLHFELLSAMSNDEVLYAYREFLDILLKVNPVLEQIPEKEVEELIAAVKKVPSLLNDCTSTHVMAMLLQVLGLQREDLQAAKFYG